MYDRSEFKGFAQGEIKGFAQGELKGFKPDFQTDNRDVQSEKHTPQSRDEIRVDTQSMLTKQGSGRWSIRYLAVKDYNEVLALQEKFYGLDPTVDEVLHGLL